PHPKIRVGTQFYRGFVVIPTDLILKSKYLWVRLWLPMDRVGKLKFFKCSDKNEVFHLQKV
uniref:hypothetical protein n=1 Tax=Leptospira kirschneri TaxID=29507 RepID=UPI0021004255